MPRPRRISVLSLSSLAAFPFLGHHSPPGCSSPSPRPRPLSLSSSSSSSLSSCLASCSWAMVRQPCPPLRPRPRFPPRKQLLAATVGLWCPGRVAWSSSSPSFVVVSVLVPLNPASSCHVVLAVLFPSSGLSGLHRRRPPPRRLSCPRCRPVHSPLSLLSAVVPFCRFIHPASRCSQRWRGCQYAVLAPSCSK